MAPASSSSPIVYPDANHGSQYQYSPRFARCVSMFLSDAF
jgi:hypothetical protein